MSLGLAMTKSLGLVLLPLLITSCTTVPLTPERSAALQEMQRFADEVTNAYSVRPVEIMVYEARFAPRLTWGRYLMLSAAVSAAVVCRSQPTSRRDQCAIPSDHDAAGGRHSGRPHREVV